MKRVLLALLAASPAALCSQPQPGVLPDFQLTAVGSDRARRVTRRDFEGKVWVASFMFTRCHGPCPVNSAKMERLQKVLPAQVRLASFTVDPKNDQAKALRAYAKRFHAQPGRWVFLTAPDEEALIPLYKGVFRTAYRASASAPCGYETYHSSKFFLIDPRGAIRGEYSADDPAQMRRLEADARALAGGASQAAKTRRGNAEVL